MSSSSDSVIKSHFEQQRSDVNRVINELDVDVKGNVLQSLLHVKISGYITIADLRLGLKKQGLDPLNHPEIKQVETQLLKKAEERLASSLQLKDVPFVKIEFEDMYSLIADKDNNSIVQRALTNQVTIFFSLYMLSL